MTVISLDDDIIRKNPARNDLSSDYGGAAEEKDVLTTAQQERLFAFMRNSNVYNVYIPMITVMLETGLRCGDDHGIIRLKLGKPSKYKGTEKV